MPEIHAARAVRLPRPARGGWLLMLAVGGALATIGGLAILRDRGVGLLCLGGGLVFLAAASLMLARREISATLRLVDGDELELAGDDGLAVRLALAPPVRSLRVAGPSGAVVAIADRHGIIELASLENDDIDALAALTERAAARTAPDRSEPKLPPGVRMVKSDPLELRWRALSPARAAAWVGLSAGLTSIAASASARPIVIWLGLALALALGAAGGFGAQQRLRVDGVRIEVERVLFGRVQRSAVALSELVGIDAVNELGLSGPGIVLRTAPIADPPAIAHPGIHVPTEGLSLAARVALARHVALHVARHRTDRVSSPARDPGDL